MRHQGHFSSLNGHQDYVRAIDYSSQTGRLFSASDDGMLYMWDLNAEKIMQKYQFADEGAPVVVDLREESKEEAKQPPE